MRTKRDHSNWVIRLAGILLCLTLFSMHLTSGLYARYTTSASGGDSARVAAFGFYVQNDGTKKYINLEQIRVPGDSQTVIIHVSNNKGGRVAEVAMTYELTVLMEGSMPLICEIEKNSEPPTTLTHLTNAPTTGVFRESIGAATSDTDTYTLTVTWPVSYSNGSTVYYNDAETYASGSAMAEMTVSIVAEQVD